MTLCSINATHESEALSKLDAKEVSIIIGSWCFYQTESFFCLLNWQSKKVTTKASEGRMLGEDWSHQQEADTESDQIY